MLDSELYKYTGDISSVYGDCVMTTRSGARYRPVTPSVSEMNGAGDDDGACAPSVIKSEDVQTLERTVSHLTDTLKMALNSDTVRAGAMGTSTMDKDTDYRDKTRRKTTLHSHSTPVKPRPDWEHENDSSDDDRATSYTSLADDGERSQRHAPKLPVFSGKESWTVWFNRFSDVADQFGWGDARRLMELLPRMLGDAGEFVYNQLSRKTRRDYKALIAELNNRFRVVETRKSYAVKFSKRLQTPGESPEDFAAELKRLYDKGYKNRDPETRREDLLRRYLDGMHNRDMSFQVEYFKDPASIEDAVFQTVLLSETKTRGTADAAKHRPSARAVQCDTQHQLGEKPLQTTPERRESVPQRQTTAPLSSMNVSLEIGSIKRQLEQLQHLIASMQLPSNRQPVQPARPATNQKTPRLCYGCGMADHFVRDCPVRPNQGVTPTPAQIGISPRYGQQSGAPR